MFLTVKTRKSLKADSGILKPREKDTVSHLCLCFLKMSAKEVYNRLEILLKGMACFSSFDVSAVSLSSWSVEPSWW